MGGFTYIVASARNGTIYTGVTSDLVKRAYQHRHGLLDGFSSKYGCKLLVWYEQHETIESAIVREKQVKDWQRKWKLELIEKANSGWRDLSIELLGPTDWVPAFAGMTIEDKDAQ